MSRSITLAAFVTMLAAPAFANRPSPARRLPPSANPVRATAQRPSIDRRAQPTRAAMPRVTPATRTQTPSNRPPGITPLVDSLTIEHVPLQGQGTFRFAGASADQAEVTYARQGNTIIIAHTGVRSDGPLAGQGAGKKLVEHIVTWAAEQGLRVMPVCPFAVAEFDKAAQRGDNRYAAVKASSL